MSSAEEAEFSKLFFNIHKEDVVGTTLEELWHNKELSNHTTTDKSKENGTINDTFKQ